VTLVAFGDSGVEFGINFVLFCLFALILGTGFSLFHSASELNWRFCSPRAKRVVLDSSVASRPIQVPSRFCFCFFFQFFCASCFVFLVPLILCGGIFRSVVEYSSRLNLKNFKLYKSIILIEVTRSLIL